MKTPGPNFRMSKSAKINLAVNWNRPNKTARRRSIIQAELYASEVVRGKRDKDN